jgi:hypothetical protein
MLTLLGKIRCWLRGGHGPFTHNWLVHATYCTVCGKLMGTIPIRIPDED